MLRIDWIIWWFLRTTDFSLHLRPNPPIWTKSWGDSPTVNKQQQLRRVVCLLMNTVVQRLVWCVSCWFNSAMLLVLVSMVCRSVSPLWIRNTHILVLRFFHVHLTGVSLWWWMNGAAVSSFMWRSSGCCMLLPWSSGVCSADVSVSPPVNWGLRWCVYPSSRSAVHWWCVPCVYNRRSCGWT